MVRYILVKIGEDQHEIEHAVCPVRAGIGRAKLEIPHNCQGVGEQPLQFVRIQFIATMRAFKRLIRTNKRLTEEVVQTKLFACES